MKTQNCSFVDRRTYDVLPGERGIRLRGDTVALPIRIQGSRLVGRLVSPTGEINMSIVLGAVRSLHLKPFHSLPQEIMK